MEVAPYKDLAYLVRSTTLFDDEKMVRTFFHQLLEGVEYLHSKGVSHLDLKPENVLLGADFNLKIIDFDAAYKKGDPHILSRGTRNYRAPEIRNETCMDPEASDIYSMGIILFVLMTGSLPYIEGKIINDLDLEKLLRDEDEKFWEFHANIGQNNLKLIQSFRELFLSMVKEDCVERATLIDIKRSQWYMGPIYTHDELKAKIVQVFGVQ